MEKLRVLVVPSWYPNGEDRLMGIYHKRFCEALSLRDDVEVNLLHIQRMRLAKPFEFWTKPKKIVEDNGGYKSYIYRMMNVAPISFELQRKRYIEHLKQAFRDYLKTEGMPDVIHAHVVYPAGYACLQLAREYGLPVVLTEHAFYGTAMKDPRRKPYAVETLSNVFCTTVSKHQQKEYLENGYPCEILRNVVDEDVFFKDKHIKNPDAPLELVTASALRVGKNVDTIASAMKLLMSRGDIRKMHLTIIGDGFLEKEFRQSIHSMGMDEFVSFVGRKTAPEMAEYFRKSDIYVIASTRETAYISGIEAMMCGLPIVSTRCLGPEEYVDDGTGELCEVKSPETMADAILRAYKRIGHFDAAKQSEYTKPYTKSAVAADAVDIYRRAIKEYKNKAVK